MSAVSTAGKALGELGAPFTNPDKSKGRVNNHIMIL